eukprot:gene4764-6682_t
MPKQGGQGKGKPKRKDKDFGKALIRRHLQGNLGENGTKTQKSANLLSILDNSALDDFINTTEMEGEGVEVMRIHKNDAFLIESSTQRTTQKMSVKDFQYEHLVIPRKPSWDKMMSADDVDHKEKESFLLWRRNIAALESNDFSLKVTPFEKNIDVWRQLWRVIERSDIVVQIVDARNPLLYYTEDLMKYAKEQNPPRYMMLIINKADFLTDFQRLAWVKYLESRDIKFAFYSAKIEQDKIDNKAQQLKQNGCCVENEDESSTGIEEDIELLVNDYVKKFGFSSASSAMENTKTRKSSRQIVVEGATKNNIKRIPIPSDVHHQIGGNEVELVEINDNEHQHLVWGDNDSIESEEGDNDNGNGETFPEDDGNRNVNMSDQNRGDVELLFETSSSEDSIEDIDSFVIESSLLDTTNGVPVSDNGSYDDVNDQFHRQSRVLSREELIYFLTLLPERLNILPQEKHNGRICVGMVGYPNVGKSSVINSVLNVSKSSHGSVRVAVSSTPGKTKHFQTLIVNNDLMLCDCPGLVFPSFMRSTGEMICAGILPINQMRDYIEPASVIASRVPKQLLDATYGMHIELQLDIKDNPNRPPTPHEMLCAYCKLKGFITNGTGRWDEFRACKDLLRDFTDGRILYNSPPPFIESHISLLNISTRNNQLHEDQETFVEIYEKKWVHETERVMMKFEKTYDRIVMNKLKETELLNSKPFSTISVPHSASLTPSNNMLDAKNVIAVPIVQAMFQNESNPIIAALKKSEDEHDFSEMVFGDEVLTMHSSEVISNHQSAILDNEGYEYISDDDDENNIGNDHSSLTAAKREHKRLKHWGKKNKKLRDKNPYGESNGVISYSAYSTNRVRGSGLISSETKLGSKNDDSVRRHDPRSAYGVPYVRTLLPHHQSSIIKIDGVLVSSKGSKNLSITGQV